MPKQPTSQTFTIQQSTLAKALSICSKALSDNKILPICEMFLFDMNGPNLTISACDLKIVISTSIEIQSALQTRICIPGRKLLDYVSKSTNQLLVFEIETHTVPATSETVKHPTSGELHEVTTAAQTSYSILIKTTSGKCVIPIEIDRDSFPKISNIDPHPFQLPAEDFLEMLFKTAFAISDDQLRPSATGLNICIEPEKLTCTALDFNTLATVTRETEMGFDANFIVPKKALQQIQSINPVGVLDLSVSKAAISVSWGGINITALLIDERYPDYLAIVPTENHIDFVTSRSALVNAIKRILPFADTINMVKLSISASELILIAENIDYSEEATETISGALSNGEPILIGSNGEFLLNILNSMVDDKVWFSFSDPTRAIIITEGERNKPGDKENLILLMPLTIAK